MLSLALHLASVFSQASVRVVPLSLDPLSITGDSLGLWDINHSISHNENGRKAKETKEWQFWQSAALVAAAVDAATSSYRSTGEAYRKGICSRPLGDDSSIDVFFLSKKGKEKKKKCALSR